MRILMLKATKGAPDGFTVTEYSAGHEYDLPDSLANVFVSMHAATPIAPPLPEEKKLAAAPENKAMPAPPENKAEEPTPPLKPSRFYRGKGKTE